ncbi:MAG: cyclic nucleotide-binding domain-containing protein [Gammaproteobacteria bacterium]|nr:cyclic nucleotide-binding domain-containing protein [Gammaproteobacteria bacterium]
MQDSDKQDTKRLGEYLVVSRPVLQNAVKKQGQELKRGDKPRPLGEILFQNGDVSRDELETAIRHQRVDRLRRCPVFSTLSEMELAAISQRFSEVSVPPGTQFIVQDEPDPTLFVIAKGQVEVYRTTLDGKHIHIANVGPPEPIGEMGYFQGGIRTASVRAIDATELLRAEYNALSHYFEHVPRVAHEFMRIVDRRRRATEQVMAQPSG